MGGGARMAQVLGRQKGYGAALSCKTCHQATSEPQDMRPIEMERDCGTCHALNYTTAKGTLSTLAHGDPTKALAILDGRGEISQAPLSTFSLWLRRLPGTIAKPQLPNQIQPIPLPNPCLLITSYAPDNYTHLNLAVTKKMNIHNNKL